jgi:hypothetical protein
MAQAGQSTPDRIALAQERYECDNFFMLKAMVDKVGRLDPSQLQAGLEALGDSYVPATTWTSSFSASRHNGTSSYRPLAYTTSCKCFNYVGGALPI